MHGAGCGDRVHKHIRSHGIHISLRPVFILACCRGISPMGGLICCSGVIRTCGSHLMLRHGLHVAGRRTTLARSRITMRFTSVSGFSTHVIGGPGSISTCFKQTLSFVLMRSFARTVGSCAGIVRLSPSFTVTCFGQTIIQCGRLSCGVSRTTDSRSSFSTVDVGLGVNGGPAIIHAPTASSPTSTSLGSGGQTCRRRVVAESCSVIVGLGPNFMCTCFGHKGLHYTRHSFHTTVRSCDRTVRHSPRFTRTCFGHKLTHLSRKSTGQKVTSLDGTKRLNVVGTCDVVGHVADG